MSLNRTRIAVGCISLSLLGAVAMPASAGMQILLDSTSPIPTQFYVNDGQYWQTDFAVNSVITIASSVIPLDFGGAAPASRQVKQGTDGTLAFVDALGNPTADFIAPLRPVSPSTSGSIYASSGFVDPGILGNPSPAGPYNFANALPAYRFTWSAACPATGACNGGTTVTFQTVLVAIGIDAFLVEFNYGSQTSPAGETARLSLGGQTRSFLGPFSDAGPDYCFSGGQIGTYLGGTTCRITTTAVAEPSSVALIFTGLAGICGFVGRRRRGAATLSSPARAMS